MAADEPRAGGRRPAPQRHAPPCDHAEFDRLYRTEYPPMVRLAYLITRSPAHAEEIVNEAFVAVLERWEAITSPGGYLRTVVVRAAVRTRTRRQREVELHQHSAPDVVAEPAIDEMWLALGRLPIRQRAAVVLRFYADYSHDQIAGALRCPEATARSLVHRGLAALRKDVAR